MIYNWNIVESCIKHHNPSISSVSLLSFGWSKLLNIISVVSILWNATSMYWLQKFVLWKVLVFIWNILRIRLMCPEGQTKGYNICNCCFSAKHAALRRKSKDWLAQNQDKCQSVAIFLTYNCCFSELALKKSN